MAAANPLSDIKFENQENSKFISSQENVDLTLNQEKRVLPLEENLDLKKEKILPLVKVALASAQDIEMEARPGKEKVAVNLGPEKVAVNLSILDNKRLDGNNLADGHNQAATDKLISSNSNQVLSAPTLKPGLELLEIAANDNSSSIQLSFNRHQQIDLPYNHSLFNNHIPDPAQTKSSFDRQMHQHLHNVENIAQSLHENDPMKSSRYSFSSDVLYSAGIVQEIASTRPYHQDPPYAHIEHSLNTYQNHNSSAVFTHSEDQDDGGWGRHSLQSIDAVLAFAQQQRPRSSMENPETSGSSSTEFGIHKCTFQDCSLEFSSKSTLAAHKKVHSSSFLRKHVCDECHVSFYRSYGNFL